MIETICSMELPVGEHFQIRKNRLAPAKETGTERRLAIASGIHGDEIEGQYVCYEIIRRINESPESLKGIVDIYPEVNPLGIDVARRTVPKVEMDMNRVFPGDPDGTLMERAAAALMEDMAGADLCIDVHASDKFIKEIPQARVREEFAETLLPYATILNVDMVWLNATETIQESSLVYNLNKLGVPSLVVEMGLGTRITQVYGDQVVDGIFFLMHQMGIWDGDVSDVRKPFLATDDEVEQIRASHSGIFLSGFSHRRKVQKGDSLGQIVDVLTGSVIEEIRASADGLVFTLREYPIVYEGALLARIMMDQKGGADV